MPIRVRSANLRRRATFLRQWREHRFPHHSIESIATKVGMSAAQLSRVERGLSPYTQDLLAVLAKLYKVDPPETLALYAPTEHDFLQRYGAASSTDRAALAEIAAAYLTARAKNAAKVFSAIVAAAQQLA